MDMKNTEIVKALETGDMSGHSQRFNSAPSGRIEFGQVYVIPSLLRDEIIKALSRKQKVKKAEPELPKVKGALPE